MEDKSQLQAVKLDSGSALILAGPGSGKTFVLTHHIEHLVKTGVRPEAILVITFTRKAASEMRSRFKTILPTAADRVVFGTFHSVFYRFLKIFNPNAPDIISEQEKEKILDRLSDSEDAHKEYKEIIKERNLMDFDDILDNCLLMFKENRRALETVKSVFSHVLIDEFQDINEVQYEIVKAIFYGHGPVFAVGDQDQSIYGFRGASYGIMERFINEFDGVNIIELQYNYRCEETIMKAASLLISKNQGRLRTSEQICLNKTPGRHFFVDVSKTRLEMKRQFVLDIKEAVLAGGTNAVLLRTNLEVEEYRKLLFDRHSTDLESSVTCEISNDYSAYLRYAMYSDEESLRLLLNHPDRTLPLSVLTFGKDVSLLAKKFTGTYKGDKLYVLSRQLKAMSAMTPFSFSMYLKSIVGLEEYYILKYPDMGKEIIEKVFEKIISFSEYSESLTDFLEYTVGLGKENKEGEVFSDKNLSVMTFHQAKGLEFDNVFLPEVVEGKVPGKLSAEECNVEEERRLFYVAMTRARKNLIIYTAKSEESAGCIPSRFIEDLK